jgi:hypothetical protein
MYKPNPGQKLVREVAGRKYFRFPIKTKIITPEDDIVKVVVERTKDVVESDDIVGISEKATAISQGRSYHVDEVEPSWLASFLVKFVTKSKRGVGISSPETFQLAIDECGVARIILASLLAGLGKIFGIKGVFYYIAGNKARLIDGAAEYVIPPYNKHVSKGPAYPNKVCDKISELLDGVRVAIIDINDYGGQVVGHSSNLDKREVKLVPKILKDNPLGQTNEATPIVIIRDQNE